MRPFRIDSLLDKEKQRAATKISGKPITHTEIGNIVMYAQTSNFGAVDFELIKDIFDASNFQPKSKTWYIYTSLVSDL